MFPTLFRQVGTKGCQAIVLQGELNVELWDDVLKKCILSEDPTGLLRSVLFDTKIPEHYKQTIKKGDQKWQKANLDCVLFLQATLSTQCLYVVMGMDDAALMYKRLLNRYTIDTTNHSQDLMLSLLSIRQQERQDVHSYLANIDKQLAICRFYDSVPTLEARMKSLIDGLSSPFNAYHYDLSQQIQLQLLVKNGKIKSGEAYEHMVRCILVLHQKKRFDSLVKNESIVFPKAPKEEHKWWQSQNATQDNLMTDTIPSAKEEVVPSNQPQSAHPVIANWLSSTQDGLRHVKEDKEVIEKKDTKYEELKDRMDRMLKMLETRFADLDRLIDIQALTSDTVKKDSFPISPEEERASTATVTKDQGKRVEKLKSEENTKKESIHEEEKEIIKPEPQLESEMQHDTKSEKTDQENRNESVQKKTDQEQKKKEEGNKSAVIETIEGTKEEASKKVDNENSAITKIDPTMGFETSEKVMFEGNQGKTRQHSIETIKVVVAIETKPVKDSHPQGGQEESKDEIKKIEKEFDVPSIEKDDSNSNANIPPLDGERSVSTDQWQKIARVEAQDDPINNSLEEIFSSETKKEQEEESKKKSVKDKPTAHKDEEKHSDIGEKPEDKEFDEFLRNTDHLYD